MVGPAVVLAPAVVRWLAVNVFIPECSDFDA